ncbi:hypothetical protein GWK47_047895 [Chionoecetes opilio]|uniref:Uncharacterized protein n=1 Tax=Chionoecetes opilio TaxID=41210 RepID=A0A8J4Y4B2_CHIOP|nr:hypothetical protein GWK47_047895 [Chionoecetes opilio]
MARGRCNSSSPTAAALHCKKRSDISGLRFRSLGYFTRSTPSCAPTSTDKVFHTVHQDHYSLTAPHRPPQGRITQYHHVTNGTISHIRAGPPPLLPHHRRWGRRRAGTGRRWWTRFSPFLVMCPGIPTTTVIHPGIVMKLSKACKAYNDLKKEQEPKTGRNILRSSSEWNIGVWRSRRARSSSTKFAGERASRREIIVELRTRRYLRGGPCIFTENPPVPPLAIGGPHRRPLKGKDDAEFLLGVLQARIRLAETWLQWSLKGVDEAGVRDRDLAFLVFDTTASNTGHERDGGKQSEDLVEFFTTNDTANQAEGRRIGFRKEALSRRTIPGRTIKNFLRLSYLFLGGERSSQTFRRPWSSPSSPVMAKASTSSIFRC